MSERKYIECGKIINTHGCHGDVKIESWCNSPDDFTQLKKIYLLTDGVYIERKIKKASIFKQFVIAKLEGIDDMDAALVVKGTVVYANRDDFKLEEGEYFIADMIGVNVIDISSGKIYGKISDIINRGASDIYVVQTDNGEKMIPVVDEFIVKADIRDGVFVKVIPGLLD